MVVCDVDGCDPEGNAVIKFNITGDNDLPFTIDTPTDHLKINFHIYETKNFHKLVSGRVGVYNMYLRGSVITADTYQNHVRYITNGITFKGDLISVFTQEYRITRADYVECCVCFEKSIKATLHPCGHNDFCKTCVGKVGTCPICRTEISYID
jgi:hypothetical protein